MMIITIMIIIKTTIIMIIIIVIITIKILKNVTNILELAVKVEKSNSQKFRSHTLFKKDVLFRNSEC